MKNKKADRAKLACLLCAPLLVLAGVPAAQRYKAGRQTHDATTQLLDKLSGSLEAPPTSIEKLVAAGADVNRRGSNGFTPLHWAAVNNSPDEARVLLDKGAKINRGDGWGETALARASWYGSSDVVRFLLKRGAQVNVPAHTSDGTHTALSRAQKEADDRRARGKSVERHLEIIQLLKAAGARE